ncbi:MAG: DUF4349 domain-containing protein [Frankiales bacterium]|nr:MAG: DUF4349 domain-containing protein [Frankiales bacterium]
MGTLTDEDLTSLLGEAAASFDVPDDGPDAIRAELADEAEVVPFYRHRRLQVAAAAAVVLGGIALGATVFGGSGDTVGRLAGAERPSSDGSGTGGDAFQRQSSAGAGTAPARQLTGSTWTGTTWTPAGESAAREAYSDKLLATGGTATGSAAAPAAAGGGTAASAPAPAAPTADGARVVKTGAIALVVGDGRVTPVLTEVQQLAQQFGGEVSVAKTEELGDTPSGSVTLRVPVDQFEEVVAKVRSLDAEVRSATTSGKDVTAEYADLQTQIRTLTAARERFLEILSRARTIGDVLAVQQRIDDATGKIDRLEGQRRVLAAQSERATLEVMVTEADDPVVTKAAPDDGISKAFSDAWHGFTTGVEGLIRLSGRGVLLLICLAVAFVVLRLGWRASRRRLV